MVSLRLLPAWARIAASAVLAAALSYGLGRHMGASTERAREAVETAQETIETLRRIDHADSSTGDANADLDWLRERARARSGSR